MAKKRLPSNLRSTVRECVYLVRRAYSRSRDEDGVTPFDPPYQNPKLRANFTAVSSIEPELLPIEDIHCRDRDFLASCSCGLDLDLMTFIYELNPHPLNMYHRNY